MLLFKEIFCLLDIYKFDVIYQEIVKIYLSFVGSL